MVPASFDPVLFFSCSRRGGEDDNDDGFIDSADVVVLELTATVLVVWMTYVLAAGVSNPAAVAISTEEEDTRANATTTLAKLDRMM